MKNGFEDLMIWKRSYDMSVKVYNLLFHCKDFGLKDQILRAAVSVPSNIAEGYERGSGKEFAYFLRVAKGSIGELRTQLYLAGDLNYMGSLDSAALINECKEISCMINSLISKVKSGK